MSVPSAHELEAQFAPIQLKELPLDVLAAVREHSKRMFGNQDRLEVAVAITRVELGKVNATDLHKDTDIAVNRIRAQLLALEALGLLAKTGDEHGKRMFERIDHSDRFWAFVVNEYEGVIRDRKGSPTVSDRRRAVKSSNPSRRTRPLIDRAQSGDIHPPGDQR
jgi:hypothetical protein